MSTAANAAFSTMATNIGTVGTNKYNSGYSSGRSQGQNDVKNSPNSYSLFTAAQYNTYGSQCYNNGYNAGVSAGSSSVQNIIISSRNNYVSIYLPYINGFTYSGSNSDGYFLDDGYKGIMSNGYYNSASFSGYTWISFG